MYSASSTADWMHRIHAPCYTLCPLCMYRVHAVHSGYVLVCLLDRQTRARNRNCDPQIGICSRSNVLRMYQVCRSLDPKKGSTVACFLLRAVYESNTCSFSTMLPSASPPPPSPPIVVVDCLCASFSSSALSITSILNPLYSVPQLYFVLRTALLIPNLFLRADL